MITSRVKIRQCEIRKTIDVRVTNDVCVKTFIQSEVRNLEDGEEGKCMRNTRAVSW